MKPRKLLKFRINPKEWEFEFQQRNEQPILMADLTCQALYSRFQEQINLPVRKDSYIFTATSKGYAKRAETKRVKAALWKATQREAYLGYIFETTRERTYEFERVCNQIARRASHQRMTNKEMAALWEKFVDAFLTITTWFYIPWYVTEENILSDRVKRSLNKYGKVIIPITDLNNALMILIFPERQLLFQKEQKEFYELVELCRKSRKFTANPKFQKQAQGYLTRYAWTKTFFLLPIEPLGMKELLLRIKSAMSSGFGDDYRSKRAAQAKDRQIRKRLERALPPDELLWNAVDWARKFGWLLTWGIDRALIAAANAQPFFKSMAKRLRVPFSEWSLLTSEEITGSLWQRSLTVNQKELRKRKQAYVFLMENGKRHLVAGPEALALSKWIDARVGALDARVDSFKGQPASPGTVRGSVRIAMTANDARKVREGDILVCSMTSPDYILAMKRASAVVTDEGGLLSHAAIVSRELGVPCVIGTKIATKVLKTGDLVEVDANRGIVRKL